MCALEIPTLRSQTPSSRDNHKAAGIIRNTVEIRIVSESLCLTFWVSQWPFTVSVSNHVWLTKWDSFVWFWADVKPRKPYHSLVQTPPPLAVIWFLLFLPSMFCCAFFLRHLKGKLVTRLTFPSFFPRLLQLPLAESDASDSHWLLYRSERVMRHTAGSCRVGVCNCYCEGSVRASPADNITATSCEGGATGADSEFVLVGGIWTPSSLYANDRDTNTCLNADKLNPPNLHPSLIVPSKKTRRPLLK